MFDNFEQNIHTTIHFYLPQNMVCKMIKLLKIKYIYLFSIPISPTQIGTTRIFTIPYRTPELQFWNEQYYRPETHFIREKTKCAV